MPHSRFRVFLLRLLNLVKVLRSKMQPSARQNLGLSFLEIKSRDKIGMKQIRSAKSSGKLFWLELTHGSIPLFKGKKGQKKCPQGKRGDFCCDGQKKKCPAPPTGDFWGGFGAGRGASSRAGRREEIFGISDAIRYCQRASLTVNRLK